MMHIVYRHADVHTNTFLSIDFEEIRVGTSLYSLPAQGIKPFSEPDRSKPEEAFYYIVDSEEKAAKLATHCAARTPGIDWYWAPIAGKVTSRLAPTTVTTYTEKGALPK